MFESKLGTQNRMVRVGCNWGQDKLKNTGVKWPYIGANSFGGLGQLQESGIHIFVSCDVRLESSHVLSIPSFVGTYDSILLFVAIAVCKACCLTKSKVGHRFPKWWNPPVKAEGPLKRTVLGSKLGARWVLAVSFLYLLAMRKSLCDECVKYKYVVLG